MTRPDDVPAADKSLPNLDGVIAGTNAAAAFGDQLAMDARRQAASVTCTQCGRAIDEPTNLDPGLRKPCPTCGSLNRRIAVSAWDQLNAIDSAYAAVSIGSNTRLDELAQEAAQATTFGDIQGTKPRRRSASEIQIAVAREEGLRVTAAVTALVDTVRVGQAEAAKAATSLSEATTTLIWWTKVIGVATLVSIGIAVGALVVAARR